MSRSVLAFTTGSGASVNRAVARYMRGMSYFYIIRRCTNAVCVCHVYMLRSSYSVLMYVGGMLQCVVVLVVQFRLIGARVLAARNCCTVPITFTCEVGDSNAR